MPQFRHSISGEPQIKFGPAEGVSPEQEFSKTHPKLNQIGCVILVNKSNMNKYSAYLSLGHHSRGEIASSMLT